MNLKVFLIIICSTIFINAQLDTLKYQWPVPPFNSSQTINGTFGEFRNTGSSDHFHNAVDIGEPDGNPVYASMDGVIYTLVNNGYNSYINVKSIVDGKKKHITYYHVVPNPNLSLGQQVYTGLSVLGTIYVGAGHVHLIERELVDQSSSSLGIAINPIRPEGGLNPYSDIYAPVINRSTLKFFKDRSSIPISSDNLYGKVDIRIRVDERNGPSSSHTNNGTYILGYRIFSDDGYSIMFEPDNDGLKYRFYRLPIDSYVHNVFVQGVATLSNPTYWLTNGNGESQINSTLTVPNNFLDTDLLNEGNYILEIFSEDTRNNRTKERFPIYIFKLAPELRTVLANKDTIKISWSAYNLNKIIGYRIYFSEDEQQSWKIAANESLIGKNKNEITLNYPLESQYNINQKKLYFYITAVDSFGFESKQSDIYSCQVQTEFSQWNTIIVDGFDRFGESGSWKEPSHNFNKIYSEAFTEQRDFQVSSASNEAIIDELVNLNDYDIVFWFVGDESTQENTFTNLEQFKLAQYLENGGNLFVSGENIGEDLDTKHIYSEFSDTLFYRHYLKAKLMHEGNSLLYEVNGQENTLFEGLHINFGETYEVDSPDDIEPINGSIPILNYTYERDGSFRKGGIAYTGTFGESSKIGKLVYISFPIETIEDKSNRTELFSAIMEYFGLIQVSVNDDNVLSEKFELIQNYPNPFNPNTIIEYTIPVNMKNEKLNVASDFSLRKIILKIYDSLGKEVETLVNELQKPGNYKVTFDGSKLSSGVYFYQIRVGNLFMQTKKMLILK